MSFLSIPNSSNALIISVIIPSGPGALLFLIFFNAAHTSNGRIDGLSMFVCILGTPPQLSSNNSSIYSDHLSIIISLSIVILLSFPFIQPLAEHYFHFPRILVKSATLSCNIGRYKEIVFTY